MNHYNHQFFNIKNDVLYTVHKGVSVGVSTAPKNLKEVPNSIHVVCVCVYCGQVRHVYADGTIEIKQEYGKVKQDDI